MNKIIRIIKDRRGLVEMTSFVLLSWIVIMLAVVGLEMFLAGSRFIAVNNSAQQVLEMMRIEGSFTSEIEQLFYQELDQAGVSERDVRIIAATKNTAHRGQPVEFFVETKYKISGFRPLGLSEERLTLYWNSRKSGVSRCFIRETAASGG